VKGLKLQMERHPNVDKRLHCYHCGDIVRSTEIHFENKVFCCEGCKTVFAILSEKDLCNYYVIDKNAGIKKETLNSIQKYNYLDDQEVKSKLLLFTDDIQSTVEFTTPGMHCSSCIWLLEQLYRFDDRVINSRVNFLAKTININFKPEMPLSEVAFLIDSLGYEPDISLEDLTQKASEKINKKLYYQLGVAGFCFGNIMLFSFPEYFSITSRDALLQKTFTFMNILLSLPVFFYSASDYYISALQGLKKKIINLDFPLALGMFVLFLRSIYDISTGAGPGFLDSLSGLVFFLLVGKAFQNKTYEIFNFERNLKSYFPIAVTAYKEGIEKQVFLEHIRENDKLLIRNNEIIPADSYLISGEAHIDYSFVTGESSPVTKRIGDKLFAGGTQKGAAIEISVAKEVSQSYLTKLWNDHLSKKQPVDVLKNFSDITAKYFTMVLAVLAIGGAVYWSVNDPSKSLFVFTAVLIVACPCALALTTPFVLGNALRFLGRRDFYSKNTRIVEHLKSITDIVFDKTGTLTITGNETVSFSGESLSDDENNKVKSAVKNSVHPLSKMIYASLEDSETMSVEYYKEIPGEGISCIVGNSEVRIGSQSFVLVTKKISDIQNSESVSRSFVYLAIDGDYKGYYEIKSEYRDGVEALLKDLGTEYNLHLLSGDNDSDKERLISMYSGWKNIRFNNSPKDKKEFIEQLQKAGSKVLMVGDGMNDSGALNQSDIGISISENVFSFTPASDIIVKSKSLYLLPKIMKYSKNSLWVIYAGFTISLVYNAIGLMFALSGELTPLIAAILMPVSSITAVVFSSGMSYLFARVRGLI